MNADDKKILNVKVERLVGAYEEESAECTDDDDNPIRGFLKRNLGNDDEDDGSTDNTKHEALKFSKVAVTFVWNGIYLKCF